MKPRVCTRTFDYILHQILKMGILFPDLMRKISGKIKNENPQSLKKAEFRIFHVRFRSVPEKTAAGENIPFRPGF
ncbi:MAG: hypothetical protein J6J31_10410 [Thermoguttaceae bacterium]|nr:hypothetical protein [Thermoguttaceae bacterium]